ncbi:MAG: hypothetical protein GY943_16175, partial [Chloroflexi bacterium]|nr:hypothetical protein [Chloroflexota bacterium]
ETGLFVGDDQDNVAETDGNMTVDFGFVPVVTLGSFVWIDQDGDGLQDVGEPGILGADVALFVDNGGSFVPAVTVTGTAVLSQTTGADGLYHFINLPPGDYRVQVTPPSQYIPTLPQTTADNDDAANDSNIATEPVAGTYESGTFTLTTGGEPVEVGSYDGDNQDDASDNSGNMTVDFGFIEPVSIGSFIWEDIDYDGAQDGGELGIPGITVTLWVDNGSGFVPATDVNGTAVLTQTTLVDGQYFFDNLPPGDYRIQVTPPAKFVPTPVQTTADNDGTEDDSNIATEPVTGTYETGTFTLTVDGESTETGTFDGDDQDDTADNDGDMTVDIGFVQPVSIGSLVWEDSDSNGAQDIAEPAIAGAVVELLFDGGSGFVPATDVNGTAVLSQTTAVDGLYNFTNLPPGDYRVQVTPPTEFVPTPTQTAADDDDTENDSNVATEPTAGTYESGTFTLAVASEPAESGTFDGDTQDDAVADDNGNMTVDFGFVPVVSIGSLVWEDVDGDGVQESGEPGITGATVTLWVDDGFGTFVAATDVYGTLVSSQLTAADGQYFFNNLPEGDYRVQVTPPAGYTPTRNQETAVNNDTENDSNIATEPVVGTYESGTFTLTRDGEPVESNSRDGDAQDDAIGAYTDDNNGNMTVDFGFYQPVAIGNVVWIDDGAGGATALDGILGGTEAGVPSVELELYWATDTPGVDAPYITTTTNVNGEYLFDMIPRGDYIVHIPASQFVYGTPLSSFISSTGHGGDDANDDDINENGIDNADPTMNGISSETISLAIGAEPIGETGQGSYPGTLVDADVNMTVDFGFFELLTLGNRVWFDADNDAVIGGAELGTPGVVMNLLDAIGDPVLHPITGLPITTTTDVDGYYQFIHLYPGDYIVQVAPENFQTGGVLEIYLNSTGSTDPDNDVDSDDNGNDGSILATDGVVSDPVTLNYDAEPDSNQDTDDNNNTNLSVDFGFYMDPTAVTLISFTAAKQTGQDVLVKWQTGSEIDNFGFRLYRASTNDFSDAAEIHFEATALPGGNGSGASYQYADAVPSNGTWYYWLVDVDTFGATAVHGPVSVSVSPVHTIFMPFIVSP